MATSDPCSGPAGESPLVALLGRAEAAFIAEFDRRLSASDFSSLSIAHSRNVLRHLGSGPLRASQIVGMCDVSKQAISQQLTHLEAAGYVSVEPDPADQRARVVSLTARGEAAQRFVQTLFAEIEADWAVALGARDAASLRRILVKVVDESPTAVLPLISGPS